MSKNRTIKMTLAIDGEREYKEAIGNISKSLDVLNSELRLVDATYKDNATSVKALTERSDVLERKLLTQTDKVNELRKAHEYAAQTYGESSKKTMDLATKLNNAEAAQKSMEREVASSRKELEKATKSMHDYGLSEEDATDKSGGLLEQVKGLTDEMGIRLPGGLDKAMSSMGGAVSTVGLLSAGFAALIAAEKEWIDLTVEAAANADEVLTKSLTSGMSTDAVQEWRYAAELLDVSFSTVESSTTKLIASQRKARDGSKEQQEAFRKLHVEYKDGSGRLRDANDVFLEAVDALGKIKNETDRDALSMQLMGRSARDLNPLIAAGSRGFRELANEARRSGYVMSGEQLNGLGAVDDAIQRLNNSTVQVKNTIAQDFAPSFTELVNTGSEALTNLGTSIDETGLGEMLGYTLEILGATEPLVSQIISLIAPLAGDTLRPLVISLALVADALTLISNTLAIIIECVKWLTGNGTRGAISKYWGNMGNVFSSNGATARAFANSYANGTDYHPGGLAKVGERGWEYALLPEGTRVFTHHQSVEMEQRGMVPAYAGGVGNTFPGGDTWNVTVDARNIRALNDLVRVAENARLSRRKGYNGRRK